MGSNQKEPTLKKWMKRVKKAVYQGDDEAEQRRYLGGLKPAKYYDEIIWPEHEETLRLLGLTYEKGKETFEAFIEIDEDNGGEVSIEEFHAWLGLQKTKFSERVFGILDLDGSGFLDFYEFAIGVWNFCTYDASLMTKLAFDIFDADKCGCLEMPSVDALLRMVYDVRKADPALLKKIDSNGDGRVTLDELERIVETHNYVLQPAFDLQRALRQRISGVRYWETEMQRRRVYFSGYDAGAQSSWDSIQQILQIKSKERFERENRARELERAEKKAEEDRAKQRELQLREEIAARRRRRLESRLKAQESAEAKAERAARERLERAHENTDEECIAADLHRRLNERREYWDAFDDWVDKSRVARDVEKERRLKLVPADAEAKLEDALREDDSKFQHETLLNYAYELHDHLKTKKHPYFHKLADSLLVDHFGDGAYEPTAIAKFSRKFASKSKLATAREAARSALLHDARVKEETAVRQQLKQLEIEQEALFVDVREKRVGEFYGPDSKWERLWDGNHGAPYWIHWTTNQSTWAKPHVCHVCDAMLDPEDAKCFTCDNDRSQYNLELYWDVTGTRPVAPEDDADARVDEREDAAEVDHLRPTTAQATPLLRSSSSFKQRSECDPSSLDSSQKKSAKPLRLEPDSSSSWWVPAFARRQKNDSLVLPGYLGRS